jgi:pimeloyl-ACP methyl ester carboxylesterase
MKKISIIAVVLSVLIRVSDAQVPSSDPVHQPNQSEMSEPKSSGPKPSGPKPSGPKPNGPNIQTDESDNRPVGYFNLKTKTFGGQQFWTDVRFVGGWRVQNNSETKHFRLIDSKNVRHAWGNQLHCDQVLDQAIENGDPQYCQGPLVILLHGLSRSSKPMRPLAKYLQKEGGYTVINFEYASTRKRVEEHAIALRSVIDSLGPGVTEINLVGHSLGNIVVRRYLADNTDPVTGRQGDPRIKRAVMIGPPNQGSRMARLLKSSRLFQTFAGASGSQLSQSWEQLEPTLATPEFEFGIIAGGQESERDLSNFVLSGKDDFTVSVAETKLDGAHDFLIRPLFHATMMKQPDVLEATLTFLKDGHFVSESERTPLPVVETSPSSSADSQTPLSADGGGR